MAHQEENSIRYSGQRDSVPNEERQELDSAFVDVMTTAQFNRDDPSFDGTIYGLTKRPFSRFASGFLRNVPQPEPQESKTPEQELAEARAEINELRRRLNEL